MKFSTFIISAVSVACTLAAPSLQPRQAWAKLNIHPKSAPTKCIGVLGGKFIVGSAVDIYDCNGSPTQGWSWNLPEPNVYSQLFVTNPANDERFCMDIPPLNGIPGGPDDLYNGAKLVLKKCDVTEPGTTPGWQSFGRPFDTGANGVIPFSMYFDPEDGGGTGELCVDLTDGITTNRNVLQLWSCNPDRTKPWKNQIWTVSEH